MAAFTVTQYQALCQAIASGELTVKYDGKEVTYRSVDQLMRAKAAVEADLVAAGLIALPNADGVVRGGTTYASFGLD